MTDPVTRLPVQAPPLPTGDVQLQDLPARCSAPDESGNSKITNLITDTIPDRAGPASDLHTLLDTGPYRVKEERALIQRRTVEPATTHAAPSSPPQECILSAPPSAHPCLSPRMRNGKIARLPKLERDLVNKLLHNHIPYSKIVWALSERNITVTERNISNWRTRGGYKEWCAEQENQLRLAHLQDHLTDYLRKHDAQQLPEVGLQVAATQLTSLLMNPQTAAPLLADPNKYSRVVDALDKCSVRLGELQKARYDNVGHARIQDTVPHIRCEEAREVENIRQIASAAKLGEYAQDENTPHRNDLPPREELPYLPPRPTFWQMMAGQLKERSNPKPQPASPLPVAQPPPAGNQTETPGNSR